MVDIVTPSTGAVREGGDLGLNVRGFAVGDRVLCWKAGMGWAVGAIVNIGETMVGVDVGGALPAFVTWREIAGRMKPNGDAAALVLNMRNLEKRGDEGVALARKRKRDSLFAVMECGDLDKVSPFVPGM